MYNNNARNRDSNSRCNYCGNFRKCRQQDISFQVQITILAERSDEESLPYVHDVSVIALEYDIACQQTEK